MTKRDIEIGVAELEVLKTLWDGGPGTVRDVLNRLTSQGRTLAYTTVQTLLTRLEQKKHVVSDKSGLAYHYRPVLTRDRVSESRVKSLVEQLYDGMAAPLVLQLIKSETFTADEIAALQKLIDQLDRSQE